jgi:hypothetical protein
MSIEQPLDSGNEDFGAEAAEIRSGIETIPGLSEIFSELSDEELVMLDKYIIASGRGESATLKGLPAVYERITRNGTGTMDFKLDELQKEVEAWKNAASDEKESKGTKDGSIANRKLMIGKKIAIIFDEA